MEIVKNKLIMIKEESFKYNYRFLCSDDTINFIKNILKLQQEPEEVIYLLGLDTKSNIIGFVEIARGTLSNATTSLREILKKAIVMNSHKIILTHNHPSGDPTPSKCDIDITNKLDELSKMLDITLLDHIIIGDDKNYSIFAKKEI